MGRGGGRKRLSRNRKSNLTSDALYMIVNDFMMLGSDIIYAPYLKYKNTKYNSKIIQFSHSSGNDLHEKHEYSLSFKTINKLDYFHIIQLNTSFIIISKYHFSITEKLFSTIKYKMHKKYK